MEDRTRKQGQEFGTIPRENLEAGTGTRNRNQEQELGTGTRNPGQEPGTRGRNQEQRPGTRNTEQEGKDPGAMSRNNKEPGLGTRGRNQEHRTRSLELLYYYYPQN